MIVGIDIRILGKSKRTGVEDYTINLLSFLLSKNKEIKYKLFYNGFRKLNMNYDFLKLPNVELKKMRFPNRFFDLFLRFLKFPKLDKLLGGVDVFLSPHLLVAPVQKKTKKIVIFYDLSFIRFPEFFPLPKLFWHKFIYSKKQAKRADLIIAISESTKNDLINLYNIDSDKIKVIYPGISEKFKPVDKKDSNLERVRRKYNLPENLTGNGADFLLYFGTIEPRKNILGLIKAFENLKSSFGADKDVSWKGIEGRVRKQTKRQYDFSKLKLIIAGSKGWLYKNVFKLVENSSFKKDIIFTDFIEEQDKIYLYNLASVFVYPSFFEGFGLPPLEAMACGVPVVCSDNSSLPEVVGDSGIMINPNNFQEISWAIKEILEKTELRDCFAEKGIKRSIIFNWENVIVEFLKIFNEIAKK